MRTTAENGFTLATTQCILPKTVNRKQSTYLRDDDLGGLEIRFARQNPHAFPKHSHETYTFGLMEDGGAYCLGEGDDKTFLPPGRLALFNPEQIHTGIPRRNDSPTYRMFYVAPDWMRSIAGDLADGGDALPEFTGIVVNLPKAWGLLRGLTGLIHTGAGRLEKETAMYSAFAEIIAACADGVKTPEIVGPEPKAVRIAKEVLAADLDAKLSLQDVARHAGVSRFHLIRVFKQATGLSPHAFRTQQRIHHAKHLIKRGAPFAQIALETGFTDQSHFTNTFKRLTGATPGQYV